MRKMISDQQYQQLVAKSNAASNVPSHLLLAPSQLQGVQHLSRKLYGDRALAADPYSVAIGGSGPPVANGLYSPQIVAGRLADPSYSAEGKELRAQMAVAADRRPFPPSAGVIDYVSPAYFDHVNARTIAAAAPMAPEAAYPLRYDPSSLHGATAGVNVNQSELLARARRPELQGAYAGGLPSAGVQRFSSSAYEDHHAALTGQAGFLGAGVRRGRDLERYLLTVQPEKLVRYAASCLAPEPPLRYPVIPNGNNLSDDDKYSNYRKARARRIGSNEYRDAPPEPHRDSFRERELREEREYRAEREHQAEREHRAKREHQAEKKIQGARRRGETSRDLQNETLKRSSKHDSEAKEANTISVDRNGSQPLEGKEHRVGGQKKRPRISETSELELERPEQGRLKKESDVARQEKENEDESDKDSELGSLCADRSDSDDELVKKPEETSKGNDGPLPGMIFGCSSVTFHECMRLQLFGLPAKNKEEVMRVRPGTKLFLFNFDTKELSGIFEAVSHGEWQIQPDAFREFGGFPAQVEVRFVEQCPNLSLSEFKPAIQQNYISQFKFRFDLTSSQVRNLVKLFREAQRARPRHHGSLADEYMTERLHPAEYARIGGRQNQIRAAMPIELNVNPWTIYGRNAYS